MGSRWRIRHKLLLGLGLVMLIMTLLLLGTFRGLWAYYQTTNRIRVRLAELVAAEELKSAVFALVAPTNNSYLLACNKQQLGAELNKVRGALTRYEEALNAGLEVQPTPLMGDHEKGVLEQIENCLVALEKAIDAQRNLARVSTMPTPTVKEGERDLFPKERAALKENADSLRDHIKKDLDDRLTAESRRIYQMALWIIVPSSIVGLGVMMGLMWSFYGWVFNPINDLSKGVARVRAGELGHRIDLKSGDEMEDLSKAFNGMLDQLQGVYNDLEGQVNERSRQLVRSERLASVGFLAAGVAHEINNPLASIAFCSEALEARLEELPRTLRNPARAAEEQETFHKYLKMIQEEAFRCKSITERLLEFSRTGEPRREMTELRGLVQAVLDVTRHLPNHRDKHILFEVPPDGPRGRIAAPVNAEEIKSVILNLVVNALESMEEGGRLTIRLGQKDGQAELRFTDTGCGMTPDVLENIFEPFFTRSRSGKGTGLGLTISHLIITQHGGAIDARSEGPGRGSTFIVRLPVQPRDAAGDAPLSRAA